MSTTAQGKRGVQVLNETLHAIFAERDDVVLFGEDVLDPYGGAFKVTAGLSDAYPDRVLTTPISEASLFGVAAGMALRGQRPILEIMFGDFVALGLDQVVNGISKFREMYDDQVTVPLVVRAPMGGRRGYGPTHSQSLEKLLLGIPNIVVVAASECHDVGALLSAAVDDERPVFFIENKLLYGRPIRRPEDGHIGELAVRESGDPYPALTFSATDFDEGSATVVTYGGMVPVVLEAVTELVLEHEIFCEVVALSQLVPMELDAVLASVARTGALVTAEEGTLTGGFGAEIAARVQQAAWSDLRAPVQRVAARDGIIPSARPLEDDMLPSVEDVVAAVIGARRRAKLAPACSRSFSRAKTRTPSTRFSRSGSWRTERKSPQASRSASSRRRRRRSRWSLPAQGRSCSSTRDDVEVELGKTIAYVAESADELAAIDAKAEEKPAPKPAAGDRKATRKAVELAELHGIDLSTVEKRGFITEKDVEELIVAQKAGAAPATGLGARRRFHERRLAAGDLRPRRTAGSLDPSSYERLLREQDEFRALTPTRKCRRFATQEQWWAMASSSAKDRWSSRRGS